MTAAAKLLLPLVLATTCACTATAQAGAVVGTLTMPNHYLREVVVYLVAYDGDSLPAGRPAMAVIDQRDLQFVPRVVTVTPGSTVDFPNSDPVMHNVFHPGEGDPAFDLGTYPQGEQRSFSFSTEGAYVIFCHVHPEMVAFVVVIASPYRAVTDADGRFRIDGVQPGRYRLRTWNRRLRTEDRVVIVPANGVARVEITMTHGSPAEPTAGVAVR